MGWLQAPQQRISAKFLNGDYLSRGRTERRHVLVSEVFHIGKEANKWEEQFFAGFDEESQLEYGVEASASTLTRKIRRMCEKLGQREAARTLGITRRTLSKALENGVDSLRAALRHRLLENLGI